MFSLQITKNVSTAFASAPSRQQRANTHHSMNIRIRAEADGEKKPTRAGTSASLYSLAISILIGPVRLSAPGLGPGAFGRRVRD